MDKILKLLGGSSTADRDPDDLYTTDPVATNKLLENECFDNIWECAAGLQDMSKIFVSRGLLGRESDLYTRGLDIEQLDFLSYKGDWLGDIVTNPPFKHALEFVQKANGLCKSNGRKVAMLLRLQFLEGIERGEYFKHTPPTKVLVFSRRIKCYKSGADIKGSPAMAFCWVIWDFSIEASSNPSIHWI
jgi:hypothetical protein